MIITLLVSCTVVLTLVTWIVYILAGVYTTLKYIYLFLMKYEDAIDVATNPN